MGRARRRHAQPLWTNLGTSWGHKRGDLWTILWVETVRKILRETPCAHWRSGHRTLPRRREAHPIRRATGGSIRRGNSPDLASGRPLDDQDRRGNPGGPGRGKRSDVWLDLGRVVGLRVGRVTPPGETHGSPSGGPQKAPPMPSWRGLPASASHCRGGVRRFRAATHTADPEAYECWRPVVAGRLGTLGGLGDPLTSRTGR